MAIFDVGTKTLFNQTSAPTGWTKETVNYNNHALRVVNGSILGTGGTVDFTTGFTTSAYTYSGVPTTYTLGNHTITTAQMPFHEHSTGPDTPGPTQRYFLGGTVPTNATAPITPAQPYLINSSTEQVGANVSGSTAHTHPVSIAMSGNVFSPNSTLGVNYIDVIIATLN